MAAAMLVFVCTAGGADNGAFGQFETLKERRSNLLREQEMIRREFNKAQNTYTTAMKSGTSSEISRANEEWSSWYNRDLEVKSQLTRLNQEIETLQKSGTLPNPPDTPLTPSLALSVGRGGESTVGEPTGARTPPAVIELQAARAVLSDLEKFRAAESMISRHGHSSIEDFGKSDLSSTQRELDSAKSFPPRVAPVGGPATWATSTKGVSISPSVGATKPAGSDVERLPPEFAFPQVTGPKAPAGGGRQGFSAAPTAIVNVMSAADKQKIDELTRDKERAERAVQEARQDQTAAIRRMNEIGRTGTTADLVKLQADVDAAKAQFVRETQSLLDVKGQLRSVQEGAATAARASPPAAGMRQTSAMAVDPNFAGAGDPNIVGGGGMVDDSRIRPGDVMQLIVAEDADFNANYQVLYGGYILLPRVGRVPVAGKELLEAEAEVKAILEKTQLRVATVTLEWFSRPRQETPIGPITLAPPEPKFIIYLAGEFITPGPLVIPTGFKPTLITTIVRSGGVTPSADLTRVRLLRIVKKERSQEEIDAGLPEETKGVGEETNISAILSGQQPPTDIELQPGDIVVVPPFAPIVYVTGNVEQPGTLRLFQDETLTAYAAILRAGGFARFANLKKVFVVREMGNGEKIHLPVNIRGVQAGTTPDVVLQGRDIVVVPERFFSF